MEGLKETLGGLRVVGITGGICSGKSTVCRFVRDGAGLPTIDCDAAAHQAYAPGTPCHAAVVRAFGPSVTVGGDGAGAIDRRALGARVFGDGAEQRAALATLSAIVWPATAEIVGARLAEIAAEGRARAAVVEAAVLVDAGWDRLLCTDVWVAHAPPAVVRARLMARNRLSAADADARIAAQRPPEQLLAHATRTFDTDKPLEDLRKDVLAAVADLLS